MTIFTASVFPDVARLWHAVSRRAFAQESARIEIFADCEEGFDAKWFPGVSLLPRTPSRRDHHEAYNEALSRVSTPYLAIIDSDLFWLSTRLWPRVKRSLNNPNVAAVGCVSRSGLKSHGTFSVVLKTGVYRELLRKLPSGFCKAVTNPAAPVREWTWADTGDLMTGQALRAGYDIKLRHFDQSGEIVRFDTITVFRLATRLADLWDLERETTGTFFWRGCLGNLILKRIHDRLFPEGPAYDFAVDPKRLARALQRRGSRESARLRRFWSNLCRRAERVERWLGLPPAGRVHRSPKSSVSFASAAQCLSGKAAGPSPIENPPGKRILLPGEFYHRVTFGPETVNQGAVLMSCEWKGGLFLSGSMLGGIFESGEFHGGTFWGGVFLGCWKSGVWLHGFDGQGDFRHAGDPP